ncbi:Smr/MutS family protein [Dyadobacter frigoris]|uniref:DUF2027 domain-containing protein n=1 Tax=Dyadobacter frigoris TaxID=2576211 RepID=A0A4U6CUP1_9BACT|nr:DUF2027 domain-containing protein [Dyadobacter frigoris]TKT87337.1 DUF2027 domain-containing protein [Dyadobacter frigoris]GLU55672.1 hypothetical protein Dfri01_51330 [Dyadobacter frigoris]
MNIGDKVRLVHGREEGIVYAFLPGNVIEVEIEDGFRIPVLRNELVTISPVESQRLNRTPAGQTIAPQRERIAPRQVAFSEKGIYIAFVSINDKAVTLHIINNSDWTLPFSATTQFENVHMGLSAGVLQPRTSQKLTELQMKDFENWPVFAFNLLYFREGTFDALLPFQKKIKCRAQSFYKSKGPAPVIGKDAFVFQLDEENVKKEEVVVKADIQEQLRTSLMGGSTTSKIELEKPEGVVDLHVEKIVEDPSRLSKDEILKKQLATFETSLEQAIGNGMDEITFIHGAGSGVLRDELHRRLSKNQHVQYFKDAQKEKFGYGATLVKIK